MSGAESESRTLFLPRLGPGYYNEYPVKIFFRVSLVFLERLLLKAFAYIMLICF